VFERGYVEGGAGSLNLKVYDNTSMYFQPNANLKFIREFFGKKLLYSPTVFIGWVMNVPLSGTRVKSRLVTERTSRRYVSVVAYRYTTNQITLGCELPIQNYSGFSFNVGYQVNFLSQYSIQQVTAKLNWDF